MFGELGRETMKIGVTKAVQIDKTQRYDSAIEKGEMYRKLFEEVLKFSEVTAYTDLTKSQVIEVLDFLQYRADKFERCKSDDDLLTVALVNVGYFLNIYDEDHKSLVKFLKYTEPAEGTDGSKYGERYPLTHQG